MRDRGEQPVHRSPARDVADPGRRLLDVAGVHVDDGAVALGADPLDERRHPRERVDLAVQVVRVQQDEPAHPPSKRAICGHVRVFSTCSFVIQARRACAIPSSG